MRAQHVDAGAVGEVDMMDRAQQGCAIGQARGMPAESIAEQREERRLVEGGEPLDAIAVATGDERRIIGKPAGTIAIGPAAAIVERLREIPVIEAEPGLDAGRQQGVDQTVVKGEAGLVGRAAAGGKDARPRRRKTIGTYPEIAHQRDVLAVAVVVIARDVAGIAVGDAPLLPTERIPDAGAAPVLIRGALRSDSSRWKRPKQTRRLFGLLQANR